MYYLHYEFLLLLGKRSGNGAFFPQQAVVSCLHFFSLFLQHFSGSVLLFEAYYRRCCSWRDVPWKDSKKCHTT